MKMENLKTLKDIFESINDKTFKYENFTVTMDDNDGNTVFLPTFVVTLDNEMAHMSSYFFKKYKDLLETPIIKIVSDTNINEYNKNDSYHCFVYIDRYIYDNDKMSKIAYMFSDLAGDITSTEYDKIYSEGVYKNEEVFDEYDLYLRYGISVDPDNLGSVYDHIREIYKSDPDGKEIVKIKELLGYDSEEDKEANLEEE